MKVRSGVIKGSLACWGILIVLGIGPVLPTAALELTYNEWVGTAAELSFQHQNQDVASEIAMTNDNPFVLSYQGIMEVKSSDAENAYNDPTNHLSLSETGDLGTVPTDTDLPQADTVTTVTTDQQSSEQVVFDIDLDVNGNSNYNTTNIGPQHYETDLAAGKNPPDPDGVANGTLKYYNNWDMTAANSHAYGGYGGSGNVFSVTGDANDVTEQFWVTGVFSYEYVLSGEWTYHIIQNENEEDSVAERTGYFWTSSQTGVEISGPDDQAIFAFTSQEYDLRNELTNNELPEGDAASVFQTKTYTEEITFSFLATEGVNYTFDFWADLYGHADGIANYASTGWAKLALNVTPVSPIANPEPGTIFLMGLGIFGILSACRKRFSK